MTKTYLYYNTKSFDETGFSCNKCALVARTNKDGEHLCNLTSCGTLDLRSFEKIDVSELTEKQIKNAKPVQWRES